MVISRSILCEVIQSYTPEVMIGGRKRERKRKKREMWKEENEAMGKEKNKLSKNGKMER